MIEVVLAGPINEVRSMLGGRYRIPKDHAPEIHPPQDQPAVAEEQF